MYEDFTVSHYGWLSPDGTFYPVQWGDHSRWAVDYIKEHYGLKPHKYRGGDFLVYEKNWVLINSPSNDITKIEIIYNIHKHLTKAQKEFLYDYCVLHDIKHRVNEIIK
jgi:hypothetical protein